MPYGTTSKYFSSDMPGAPAIFADAGGLVGLLDALMVTGYGAAVLSQIVVTDGVAVATTNLGHSLRKWMVALNEGTGHEGLDGEHRVLNAAGPTYTFEVTGVPDGTYPGGVVKVAPLGFEISYSTTNRRIYRSKDTERRNAVSLYVDDTNTVSGWNIGTNKALAQVKMVCDVAGMDNYTTLDTAWWHKSAAISGTLARPWLLAGDALGFYSAVDVASNGFSIASNHFMQLNTLAAGDQFATMLEGSQPTSGAVTTASGLSSSGAAMSGMDTAASGTRKIARGLAQTGAAIDMRYYGLGILGALGSSYDRMGLQSGVAGSYSAPEISALASANPATAGLVLGRDVLAVHSSTGVFPDTNCVTRALMPGLFSVPSLTRFSTAPAVTGVDGGALLGLPAVASFYSSSLGANRVGGYYVEVLKDWRNA